MKVFGRILARDRRRLFALGQPSGNPAARQQAMWELTGGKGFRVPKKGPKTHRSGKTRREIKDALRAVYRMKCEQEDRLVRARWPDVTVITTAMIERAVRRRP